MASKLLWAIAIVALCIAAGLWIGVLHAHAG
jgi:hypothetical protein